MSGGRFDYDQYRITTIAETIESIIEKNGKPNPNFGKHSWENEFLYKYSDEVIAKFKEGVDLLKKAQTYAQRIDWLLSGDDGEETFLKRLEEDLKELKQQK